MKTLKTDERCASHFKSIDIRLFIIRFLTALWWGSEDMSFLYKLRWRMDQFSTFCSNYDLMAIWCFLSFMLDVIDWSKSLKWDFFFVCVKNVEEFHSLNFILHSFFQIKSSMPLKHKLYYLSLSRHTSCTFHVLKWRSLYN